MKRITLKDVRRILIVGPASTIKEQLAHLVMRYGGVDEEPQELRRTIVTGGNVETRE
jgi:hypothetical protein